MKLRVLIIYVVDDATGLRAKATKLVDGFRRYGTDVDTLIYQSTGSKLKRCCHWLALQARCCTEILFNRHDLIFIRCAYYFFPVFLLACVISRRIHLEVNSDTAEELRISRQPVRRLLDKLNQILAFKSATTIHVVSNELIGRFSAMYPRKHFVYNPNFVVDEEAPALEASPDPDGYLNLVFLGNAAQPWQGIDLFITKVIMENEWFCQNCRLHLVGRTTPAIQRLITSSQLSKVVFQYPYSTGTAKQQIMRKMHVGIGVFNLRAKGMRETTAIKTCEYLYRGLPIVIGYRDDSVRKAEDIVLSIDLLADENATGRVNEFLALIKQSPGIAKRAHEYALKYLSVDRYVERVIENAHLLGS